METAQNTKQWRADTAKAMAAHPMLNFSNNSVLEWIGAWSEVTERTFSRFVIKPNWNIASVTCGDGNNHLVMI